MRRIPVVLVWMMLASPVHADPLLPGELFTPDAVFLELMTPTFANGSDTFCWQCDDADPSNDLQLVLGGRGPGEFIVPGYPDFFAADSIGSILFEGPASSFDGLDVSFTFRLKTTITTKVNPDGSLERLPRPSVAKGILNGEVHGGDHRELFLVYGGRVDGVEIQEAFLDPLNVPPEGLNKSLTSEIFVDQEIEYTPIPDPTSLLLLGSGLLVGAVKARRAARDRHRSQT